MQRTFRKAALAVAAVLMVFLMAAIGTGTAYADDGTYTLNMYDGDELVCAQQANGPLFAIDEMPLENGDMTFVGWTDDLAVQDKVYHAGNIVDVTSLSEFDGTSASLHAIWGAQQSESLYAMYDGKDLYADPGCTEKSETPIPDCPGYEFLGYYAEPECLTLVIGPDGQFAADDIDGYVSDGKWAVTQNVTLYAGWRKIDRFDADKPSDPIAKQFENMFKYSLDFDSNAPDSEGDVASVEKASALEAERLRIPEDVPSRDGYAFVCWNTEPDGSGVAYLPGDIVELQEKNPSAVLYAIWAVHLAGTADTAATVAGTFSIDGTGFETQLGKTWEEWVSAQEPGKYAIVEVGLENGTEMRTVAVMQDDGDGGKVARTLYDAQGNVVKAASSVILENGASEYTTQAPAELGKAPEAEPVSDMIPADENVQAPKGQAIVLETALTETA